jgi:hypothetical protein
MSTFICDVFEQVFKPQKVQQYGELLTGALIGSRLKVCIPNLYHTRSVAELVHTRVFDLKGGKRMRIFENPETSGFFCFYPLINSFEEAWELFKRCGITNAFDLICSERAYLSYSNPARLYDPFGAETLLRVSLITGVQSVEKPRTSKVLELSDYFGYQQEISIAAD